MNGIAEYKSFPGEVGMKGRDGVFNYWEEGNIHKDSERQINRRDVWISHNHITICLKLYPIHINFWAYINIYIV